MSIELMQYAEQKQKLSLNTVMKQSLSILQMPIQQLQVEIEQALIENPLLEESESYEEQDGETHEFEILLKRAQEASFDSLGMKEKTIDFQEHENIFNYIAERKTLKDYLKEQIYDLGLSHPMRQACLYIVENIDDDGYLRIAEEEISHVLEISGNEAAEAVRTIQGLEPSGIGARNLKECLKIQLHKKGMLSEDIRLLVDYYLELISTHKLAEVAKEMGVELRVVQQMCVEIRKLEPKPARGFFVGDKENYIIPEAYIRKIGSEWYIIMNRSALPKLHISKIYQQIIKARDDQQTYNYIKEKMQSAMTLLEGIEKRYQTLYKILEQLIVLQREYFELGQTHLKPMRIKDVASRIGMHESTVSRAIKDKYISTPSQVVLIKTFFTTGLENKESEDGVSSLIIKKMIKVLIDDEMPKKPLSDQQISEKLLEKNIKVSRRTVAKYREAMGILASNVRKSF